jgi:hypothetical protein
MVYLKNFALAIAATAVATLIGAAICFSLEFVKSMIGIWPTVASLLCVMVYMMYGLISRDESKTESR